MKFKYPMDGFAKESQDTENPEIALFFIQSTPLWPNVWTVQQAIMTAKRTNRHVTLNIFSWKKRCIVHFVILYIPTYLPIFSFRKNTENCLDNALTNHILLAYRHPATLLWKEHTTL